MQRGMTGRMELWRLLDRHLVARDDWMHLCCKGLKGCGVLDFDLRIAGDSHKAGRKKFAALKSNVLRAG